jgi:hypothetical protein
MVFVECKPDSLIIEVIDIASKIIHQRNKFEVYKRLEREKNCIGLIDEDPQYYYVPPYIEKMSLNNKLSNYGLKVFYDSSNNNYLVMLCPNLEEWILKAAKEANLKIERYNLPIQPTKLHKEINIKLEKFKILLLDLKNSNRLKHLQTVIMRKEVRQ